MMINCPKCSFLQEKDIYCAQCGVNMDTYKPPKKPFAKKLLGNWMVQLGLLFVVILTVVAWDSLSGKSSKKSASNLPPVSSRIERDESAMDNSPTEAPSPEENKEMELKGGSQFAPIEEPTPRSKKKDTITSLKKRVSIKVMAMGRTAIDELAQMAQRVDEGAYVVSRKKGVNFLNKNRKAIKGFSRAVRSQFEFGEAAELFMGEQDNETGVSLGFFVQVTVNESSSPQIINAEVRFWHQLRLADEPSAPLTFDVNLKSQDGFYVVDPSVHDIEFTPEETALFESSNKLSGLNNENFVENLSDIAVLIEIK